MTSPEFRGAFFFAIKTGNSTITFVQEKSTAYENSTLIGWKQPGVAAFAAGVADRYRIWNDNNSGHRLDEDAKAATA